ncbi:MAG: phage tail family protein [Ruminococcus sp.]|nr:phage tail family protein [Ruminococcus sp.]
MKFSLILENINGYSISLTHTANNYMTSRIEGLGPPSGTVSTSAYAGTDGSYLNNSFIEKRNIVISFEMRGIDIEKRRQLLYKVVTPSRYIKILYKTVNVDVYTEGYVETCEVNNFETFTSGQISIICPDIYWYECKQTIAYYGKIMGSFHFPFPESDEPFPLGVYGESNILTVENNGDRIGFTIEITAVCSAQTVTVYNVDTGEYLQIKGDIQPDDIITITTKTGNKKISLNRGGGFSTNIINWFVYGSTWLTMNQGTNRFRFEAPDGFSARIIHTNAYLGV